MSAILYYFLAWKIFVEIMMFYVTEINLFSIYMISCKIAKHIIFGI